MHKTWVYIVHKQMYSIFCGSKTSSGVRGHQEKCLKSLLCVPVGGELIKEGEGN